ncbi:carboxymuconolactone decarboxylase family protein [Campylobacter devanensis]|uniref:carboxymuconolactone decarboxylase family protein n=1 Tax=Campylobacter devanensis TaxID=3161138 RepID=UPI000A3358E4|nr:carboxymuconolactone decarboxylase family protein [Campylobacter sp. P0098]
MKKILAVFAVFVGVLMSADIEDTTLKAIFENFEKSSKNDTIKAGLSPRQIELSNLATIIASGSLRLWQERVEKSELKADEIMELLRQSTAYLGMARIREFIFITSEIYKRKGVKITDFALDSDENRLKNGQNLQIELFGSATTQSMSGDYAQIGRYLSQNCFGDYYARVEILSLIEREIITFFLLAAQGDTSAQMKAHAKAIFLQGLNKEKLIALINANIALIGYPRSLNATTAVIEASK